MENGYRTESIVRTAVIPPVKRVGPSFPLDPQWKRTNMESNGPISEPYCGMPMTLAIHKRC